jgi:CHAT domain-containing protein
LHQRARALITLGDILSRHALSDEGEKTYQSAIDDATRFHDAPSAFDAWLHYGKVLLENNRLGAADQAFAEAARVLYKDQSRISGEDALCWNMSRLRQRQRDYKASLALINRAISASQPSGGRISVRELYQTRAEVELALGNAGAALTDARTSLRSARDLRANVVPDNENRIGMEGMLEGTFSVLIEAGNQVYLETHDPGLLRETFEAAEENRAESLEALLPAISNWRVKLAAPEYRYKLSLLLREQRIALRLNSGDARERLARLQDELAQMEADAGATVHLQSGTVLDRVRRNLPETAALLSFRLGDRGSWLWTVDHGQLRLYRLPPKAQLLAEIANFQAAIQRNDVPLIARVGRKLYRDLLGGPRRSFEQSPQWFISLDEPLYTLAFSSLVVEVKKSGPVYLTQRKTLQVLPGAQLFAAPDRNAFARGRFLMAGDGIYNRADPRFAKAGFTKSALTRPASWGMARLPGSGAEVRFAAGLWRNAVLLTGPRLSKDRLLKEIDRDPDVIHIASHVIEEQDAGHSGILALGIDQKGEPDLLTSREIQMHPLHSRLVVMTGCSSGSGEALPASGLMGLTRAWLAAGAGEVLATRWATTDESGDGLIGALYMHLMKSRDGNIPEALREARLDMIAGGGWRAEPRYWSSFFLIGVR